MMQLMRIIGIALKKPFEKTTKNDIQKFLSDLEQRDFAEWTKHGYKVALKKFYKWLSGSDTSRRVE